MEIRINGKLASLKKGTSFEYVAENRLFSGSDGYTLSITFPLRGCQANLDIFGHINRQDVVAGKVIFDCEIRDRSFYKFGSITITEINEAEVKTQFLEGRSEQNFDKTFDKIYINELDLGSPKVTSPSAIAPTACWNTNGAIVEAVALPWVHDDSSSGNILNKVEYKEGAYRWHEDTVSLSWQPYLLYIVKKICEQVGYAADFSEWEEHEELRYLLVCNTLPSEWYLRAYANALPHWTVEEFFAKLELLLDCEFDIDHRARRISFAFTQSRLAQVKPVMLDSVVDEHSTEVAVEEDRCEYREAKNIVFKECDHIQWKFYSCDWFIKGHYRIKRYASVREVIDAQKRYAVWDGSNGRSDTIDDVCYAEDVDAYFIVEPVSRTSYKDRWGRTCYNYKCRLRPINLFGGRIVDDSEDAPQEEIEFIPARIDDTDDTFGRVLFLDPSGYDAPDTSLPERDEFRYPNSVRWLKAGERSKAAEFYSCIYIAWWDGGAVPQGKSPHPLVEDIEVFEDWSNYVNYHFSLRINNRHVNARRRAPSINPKQKRTFKFLSKTIPNPRAVFHIKGKRYLCEKITATFTENGMSQLLKGIFYPVAD